MLVIDAVKGAYGITSALGAGRSLSDARAARGLELLRAVILNLPGMSHWKDQDVSSDVTAEENDRLRVVSVEDITITLPVDTTYRERLIDRCGCVTILQACTNARAPKDGSRVWICDLFATIEPQLYIYRADLGNWRRADNFTLTDDLPISRDFHRYLVAMLAVELAPYEGVPVQDSVIVTAREGQARMRARYGQRADAIAPFPVISTTLYNQGSAQ